ncbi:MAG: hypothetical protein K2R93_19110 [Gemmatimonadaceae bacterium]|nr:hypothetical protein [Gemmatimonadaceae bacterium]
MYPNPQDVLPLPPADEVRAWVASLTQARATDTVRAWADAHAPRVADALVHWMARAYPDGGADRSVAEAVVSRIFGFADWATLERHLMAAPESDARRFERAADAIVTGDLAALTVLLREEPALIHARSDRVHGATLLHYVAANGVENYRQRTPANIVAIATALLDAGADVNAACDVYGGGATTLGLTVTSAHPRAAGVQEALAQRLLDRGATIDERVVHACLMNGCPEAAVFMAGERLARGGALRLDEAAGIGRVDLVTAALRTLPTSSPLITAAREIASWYDQHAVLALLDATAPSEGA